MKKLAYILLALAVMLPALGLAEEAVELDGAIEAARTVTVLAPYSGVVSGVDAKAGDAIASGDALLSIGTTAVYADFDGTVTGVFAQPGDGAASVQERYGALGYVERESLYMASCSTTGAASDNENKIIHVGEKVYLRSTQNEKRQGEGIVTAVEGSNYTVEVTDADSLNYSDRVRVYRDVRHNSSDCIGAGVISRIDPVKVTGEGYVLAVHVQAGQSVKRGDLLFELVPDQLDGMNGGDGTVAMPEDGVVISVAAENGARVEKNAPLLTYCPQGALELVLSVDEDDLAAVAVGDAMRVTLDAYPDKVLTGTVTAISGVGTSDGGRVAYGVTLVLEDNDLARIGMNATARK